MRELMRWHHFMVRQSQGIQLLMLRRLYLISSLAKSHPMIEDNEMKVHCPRTLGSWNLIKERESGNADGK
jgi:hypothetical protein